MKLATLVTTTAAIFLTACAHTHESKNVVANSGSDFVVIRADDRGYGVQDAADNYCRKNNRRAFRSRSIKPVVVPGATADEAQMDMYFDCKV